MLFWQSIVPVLEILIPYIVAFAPEVTVIDPEPVAAPIILPVVVPIFTSPARILIPLHIVVPVLVQDMFWIVLFWTLLAPTVKTFKLIPVKLLFRTVFVHAPPPQSGALPPIKFPLMLKPAPDELLI